MKIKVSSLGCRLNHSEMQSIVTELRERGHEVFDETASAAANRPDPGSEPDVVVINSCAVTLHSERKTRKLIYRAARELKERSHSRILVVGCMAKDLEQEDNLYFIPNDYKYLVPDLIENIVLFHDLDREKASPFGYRTAIQATTTRVNLKIQDGCDNYCSYCIIPYLRGEPRSKPFEDISNEFDQLLASGCKEIVLSGVMIGHYKSGKNKLDDLLEELLAKDGEFRLHLSSLSPNYVTARTGDLITHDKMVKHLHLSLQSGSNTVLQRMNRSYTREDFLSLAETLKTREPLINLTTDLITGFPGETDAEFSETMDLIKAVEFSHIHTFRYSPRPGTKAAEMNETVEEWVKKERSRKVMELYKKQKADYYAKFNNRKSLLLTEKSREDKGRGFNEYYIPIELEEEQPANKFIEIITLFDPEKLILKGTTR
ncbi:MAG: MiaB/RimO family radical SAM methylthiotransferase [bacterium]|nr:MiaB/RimO family radical SAM methylthiotransferase [bacterium]